PTTPLPSGAKSVKTTRTPATTWKPPARFNLASRTPSASATRPVGVSACSNPTTPTPPPNPRLRHARKVATAHRRVVSRRITYARSVAGPAPRRLSNHKELTRRLGPLHWRVIPPA